LFLQIQSKRLVLAALSLFCFSAFAQTDGAKLYARFLEWQRSGENAKLKWEEQVDRFKQKLKADGLSEGEASRAMRIIEARDEAALYDPIYSKPPEFQTSPNALLVQAAELWEEMLKRPPGRALDVGMGQGRNALFLASKGWQVTGFDISKVGLDLALKAASKRGLKLEAVHASDEEFDFGKERWDLIAILYPIEKRSVFRVREALKPGGLIVLECTHQEVSGWPMEYASNELLKIFEGFRILKYEDGLGMHEWARKKLRLVRIIAEKM
jgi:2-polyprenyl-3-methyl-5-hydroxy-6-metoxy-1,4-benzoquinol methylase